MNVSAAPKPPPAFDDLRYSLRRLEEAFNHRDRTKVDEWAETLYKQVCDLDHWIGMQMNVEQARAEERHSPH